MWFLLPVLDMIPINMVNTRSRQTKRYGMESSGEKRKSSALLLLEREALAAAPDPMAY